MAVGAGALTWASLGRRYPGLGSIAGLLVWLSLVQPLAAAALGLGLVARRRWKVATGTSNREAAAREDLIMLADLVALGLAAGRPIRAALEDARPHVGPLLRDDVRALLAEMDASGTAAALASAGGLLAELGRVVSSAAWSGAPVAAAVAAHADRLRHDLHTERIAVARRLPVRLLIPLALLILPGFVVLAVGPAVLEAVDRLAP